MTSSAVINVLNDLTTCCQDSAARFRKAARDVVNPALKAVFLRLSGERVDFAAELRSEVIWLGGAPERRITSGEPEHGWGDMKPVFGGQDDDDDILIDCELSEDSAEERYVSGPHDEGHAHSGSVGQN